MPRRQQRSPGRIDARDIEAVVEYDEEADVSWMDEDELEDYREGRLEVFWVAAAVELPDTGEVLQSGGLGGVSVYVDDQGYVDEVFREEAAQLRDDLRDMGYVVAGPLPKHT